MLSSHDIRGRGGCRTWGGDLIVFVGPGVEHLTDLVLPGEGISEYFLARRGDIWLPTQTKETVTEHMFPVSTLHTCPLILELICRRSTCDIAVGTACDTSPTYEGIFLPATRNIAVFTAGMPAKLNSSQLCRHAGGKDWHGFCCRQRLFSYRNGVSGSTGSYVDSSLAYENQDFAVWKLKDLEIMEASGG